MQAQSWGVMKDSWDGNQPGCYKITVITCTIAIASSPAASQHWKVGSCLWTRLYSIAIVLRITLIMNTKRTVCFYVQADHTNRHNSANIYCCLFLLVHAWNFCISFSLLLTKLTWSQLSDQSKLCYHRLLILTLGQFRWQQIASLIWTLHAGGRVLESSACDWSWLQLTITERQWLTSVLTPVSWSCDCYNNSMGNCTSWSDTRFKS